MCSLEIVARGVSNPSDANFPNCLYIYTVPVTIAMHASVINRVRWSTSWSVSLSMHASF